MEKLDDLARGQQALLEKRAMVKPMTTTPIGSTVPDIVTVVDICPVHDGVQRTGTQFLGDTFWSCPVCTAEREAEQREAEHRESDRRAVAADAARRAKVTDSLSALAIGDRFRSCSFLDYSVSSEPQQAVLDACVAFAGDFSHHRACGTNLMMIGGTGTGKNMLAALICMSVIGSGFTAVHTSAMRLVRRIKEAWVSGSSSTEQQLIDSFSSPDLLVIDEVGVQFGSVTEVILISEVINDRYAANRPTILLSNRTVAQIEEVLGKRTVDRFFEGESKVLVFNWSSYRRGVSRG